jgi:hypothetical protein
MSNATETFTYRVGSSLAVPQAEEVKPHNVVVAAPDDDDEEWCEKHQHGTFRGRCATCRDEYYAAKEAQQNTGASIPKKNTAETILGAALGISLFLLLNERSKN